MNNDVMRWSAAVFAGAIFLLLSTAITAAADDAAYRVLQDRPDRLIAVLPNRLVLVVQEVHTAPVVSAQVWVKTGSVYEQEHVGAGLSHFLEHLLASGATSRRTEEQTDAELGRIGAETNAMTGTDTVHYYINTTGAHAAEAVDLLSDWMQNSLITPEQYQRERDVIQREFDMGNGEPARILWKLTQQARYRIHPARHPTIGYIDEFLAVSRDQIYDFYKRMYVPNNAVFVVVGDVEKTKIARQVAGLWAAGKPRELPVISLPVEPKMTQPRSASGVADMDKPRLRLAWPGTRLGAEGDFALDLLSSILGEGESSRLVRHVRDEQRLINTVNAYNMSHSWGEGFFGVDAEVAVAKPVAADFTPAQAAEHALDSARDAICKEVARVRDQGVTDEELARAKRGVLARAVYQEQSAEAIASRLATDIIETGNPDYFRYYAQAVQKVTPEQVRAAAEIFLQPNRLITVTLMPQPRGQKFPPLTRSAVDKVATSHAQIAPPEERIDLDNAALVERMTAALAAGGEASAAVSVGPIERFVLSNGMRLLVQRNTLVPAVAIQFYQVGGLLADEQGREGLANAVESMLPKGTTTRRGADISRQTENLGAHLETQCGNNTSFTKVVCLAADWQALLGLVADINLHPTFPAEEWARLRPRLVAAIARQNDTWSGELHARFREAYFGAHPWSRAPLGRAEVVESLTPEQLADFHARRLGASDCVLVVMGDIDPAEVKKAAETLFADLPGQPLEAAAIKEPAAPAAAILQVKTNKPLAAVQIGLGPVGTRKSPDFPATLVLADVLGSFPAGWLTQELRGRGPGLVYVISVGQATGMVPGYLAVTFNTQPQSVPEALSRTMAVIARAKATAVDSATLERAKASVLLGEFLSKQTNSDRAADAALNEIYGLGLDEPEHFLHAVERLTPEELRNLATLYLRNPVVVVLTHEPVNEEALKKAAQE